MPTPVAPALFVHPQDVADRFEGTIPVAKLATTPAGWVQLRIEDVENVLTGLVRSLLTGTVDADRARRVKTLVVDKVLDLYRNPERAGTYRQDADGISEQWGYLPGEGHTGAISFTEDELNMVRNRTRRSPFGTINVSPWKLTS